MSKDKFKAYIAVYLVLEKENQILMYLRQNTGYADGFYSLVAGHLDGNESSTQAMIREAKEEAGIDIKSEDLQVVHIMHRIEDKEYLDIYLHCKKWTGKIRNCEPHKCGNLIFIDKDNFPPNTLGPIKTAMEHIHSGTFFSELF